jgi:amidase
MFLADGGKSIRTVLDPVHEPFREEMKHYEVAKELGVYDMWQIQAKRTEVCKQYLDRWNACEGLDAILCEQSIEFSTSTNLYRSNYAICLCEAW